jgi:DNA-directed RNA polymerase specialized sigma24 family protein
VRRKLKSLPEDTVEDLAREAMVTLYRLSRREALVNPDALAVTLVNRVCVDHVRRLRGPAGRLDPLSEKDAALELPARSAGSEASVDMLELFRFVVLEHFKQHDAPCHELAIEFFTELSWSALARQRQLRHSTVIKRWSACMEQIRELAYAQRGPVWEWARHARIV